MAGAGRETLRFPEILLWASIAYFLAGWTCSDTTPPHPPSPRRPETAQALAREAMYTVQA